MKQRSYVMLLRGINVGGKNKIPMASLRTCLLKAGFTDVATYIASGNVILRSQKNVSEIESLIEKILPRYFKLDSSLIKVLILTRQQLQAVVDHKPKGFGDDPKKYHSDVIFLMGISAAKALTAFDPKEGVDRIWPGKGVIYSERVSALRTKSRLNKIVASPLYRAMTIRNWNTTTKLLSLIRAVDGQ